MSYRHGALALSGIRVLQQREVAEWIAVPAVSTTQRFLSRKAVRDRFALQGGTGDFP